MYLVQNVGFNGRQTLHCLPWARGLTVAPVAMKILAVPTFSNFVRERILNSQIRATNNG